MTYPLGQATGPDVDFMLGGDCSALCTCTAPAEPAADPMWEEPAPDPIWEEALRSLPTGAFGSSLCVGGYFHFLLCLSLDVGEGG